VGQSAFILEPFGRNTASAVAMAAISVASTSGADSILLVLSTDHLVANQEAFTAAVKLAAGHAGRGYLVTFGVTPSHPATGFGYIRIGQPLDPYGCAAVDEFVEKPDLAAAKRFCESRQYAWNSGIFCFRCDEIMKALETHAPDILETTRRAWRASAAKQSNLVELDADLFAQVPDQSIDYAVMEKSRNAAVVTRDFGWSDAGSWAAVSELTRPDVSGNRVQGEALLLDVKNTYVRSEHRLVAAIGVNDLVVVDTPDALLIADRERTQDVKELVKRLKSIDHESHKVPRTVVRPWGSYTVIENGEGFKIKRIEVKPGAALSLQMHHHRSEHWVVVQGTAHVTNGEEQLRVQRNQSTYIPAGRRHRLSNPGTGPLVLIEVQTGSYLGEDDIVRFEDQYGRVKAS
jgi:mannose-1-phosphate guanylyltransferase/mannose-6-phosphate isomerase